jgi:hypothetical protein
MRNLFLTVTFTFIAQLTIAQRSFIDAPSIFLYTPDVQNITKVFGAGIDAGYVLGSHNLMIGIRGGTLTQFINNTLTSKLDGPTWLPYARLDAGAGLFRTNGDHCSLTQRNAYSAIVKGSLIYNFSSLITDKLQPRVGVELSYFRLRDMFKNSEIFFDPGYNLTTKLVDFSIGFRYFYNLENAGR